ncbi:MAG: trypsin-like peptidase domain-containing protein [Isosphaeraceae bacterium]
MVGSDGRPQTASVREAGVGCPHCAVDIATGDAVVVCRVCGTVHHDRCWEAARGCGSYNCAPARRPELAQDHVGPVLQITAAEIDRAIPMANAGLPYRMATGAGAGDRRGAGTIVIGPDGRLLHRPGIRPGKVLTSRLAIASLICGLLAIPMIGIPALPGIFLGLLAVGSVRSGKRRGMGLAVAGMMVGLVALAGWGFLIGTFWGGMVRVRLNAEQPPDLASIRELDPPLQRAMRANVLIERAAGWSFLGGKGIGSGVIIRIDGSEALLVTNRHVIDDNHSSDYDGSAGRLAKLGAVTVHILGQPATEGRVVWMAPGQLDLALVRVPCSSTSMAQAAPWQRGRPMRVGETVFAIGNPHDLGWTHTQGVISQFRNMVFDARRVKVIQTQASINPGNSGGGLYDTDGYCLGINTWTHDKSVSEGIGFAITLDTLADLAPTPLAGMPEKSAGADGPPVSPAALTEPGSPTQHR